jgi:hypothetical protein
MYIEFVFFGAVWSQFFIFFKGIILMRMNIVVAAGMGLVLAGCGHSSKESSTGSARVAKPSTITAGGAATAATKAGYPMAAKGLGVVGTSQVPASGEIRETPAFFVAPAPITFVETGNTPLHGTLMTSSRSNSITEDERFLMSDQSASTRDAPSAFGILSDHSSTGQFAAAGYYGGSAPTSVPTSGTATYKGTYAGSLSTGAATGKSNLHASGNLALTADVTAGKVKGDITNITAGPAGQPTSLKFGSTMSSDKASYATGQGDTISATIGGVDKVVGGQAAGGFYGAGAKETAGAITTVDGGASTVGAFYGQKQ